MAAAIGLSWIQNLVCVSSVCIVCSTIREVKTANNKETYGLSTLSAGSDLSRTLFFFHYLHNVFYAVANTIQMIYSKLQTDCWWSGIN